MSLPGEDRFAVTKPLWRGVGWMVVAVAVAVGVMLQAYALTLLINMNEQALECTQPGNPCYQERQKRLREAIVGVNRGTVKVMVAVSACEAHGKTKEKALQRCALERLAD